MTTFDFTAVKPTTVKEADLPEITRTRQLAVNPFSQHVAKSAAKLDADGKGQWLSVTLPIVNPTDKNVVGTVYGQAVRHITNAASNDLDGMGREIRNTVSDDGTEVTLYFRVTPKRTKKTTAE